MADQRITQLTQLSEANVAAIDVLPIVDISASETKKVTAKDLFEAGAVLADSASIDLVKLDQASLPNLIRLLLLTTRSPQPSWTMIPALTTVQPSPAPIILKVAATLTAAPNI